MPSSLLALLDDISTILGDVSLLAKVAHKASGVAGDDLAPNAAQSTGVRPDRELSVVLAVARGSLVNKAILVPAALAISAFAPWGVTALLAIGGAFLCFEGFEKVAHRFLHSRDEDAAHHEELARALADPGKDPRDVERDKIRGAIRTDFVLSAEVIVIALGMVADNTLLDQVTMLVALAVSMTVCVYGPVALIVKIDDFGLYLAGRPQALARRIGQFIVGAAPRFMKMLSIIGTAAMFAVGGGILVHSFAPLHQAVEYVDGGKVVALGLNMVAGVVAGAIVLGAVSLALRNR